MRPLSRFCGATMSATFLFYMFFMAFGILNVVIGMFTERATQIAHRDQEKIISNELNAVQKYSESIKKFFHECDKDHSGDLSWSEFETHLQDERVKAYFSSLQLDVAQT